MSKKHIPIWLFVISLFILLILPNLLKDGMFMDGLLYATVSNNLAQGNGSFWFPLISQMFNNPFHEHPPVVFGIQSMFFRILGESYLIERIYSFLMAIITGCFVILIWRVLFKGKELQKLSWLPFLLWITVPLTFWSYSNNILENTMGVFTIASVYVLLKGLKGDSKIIYTILIAGLLILLATLCKGFVALFPLVVIGIYWLLFRNSSFLKMTIHSLILTAVPVIILLLLLIDKDIYQALYTYVSTQVMGSLTGKRLVVERYYILQRLFGELIPMLLISIIMLSIFKVKKINTLIKENSKLIILFIAIGISASFPIMVSPKQLWFYLVPSLPYFAIGAAVLIASGVNELIQRIKNESEGFLYFKIVSVFLLMGSIVFSITQAGGEGRDEEMRHDVHAVAAVVAKGSIISICPSMYQTWSLHGYFSRYFHISLDRSDKQHEYFLDNKKCKDDLVANSYQLVDIPTTMYQLYKKMAEDTTIQTVEEDTLVPTPSTVAELYTIHFPINSSYYSPEETTTLNEVVAMMQQTPEIAIQILGFADKRGSQKYNQWISERRANRVKDYLVAKGIDASRLDSQGQGETNFAVDCNKCTEHEHYLNRRVVIKNKQ